MNMFVDTELLVKLTITGGVKSIVSTIVYDSSNHTYIHCDSFILYLVQPLPMIRFFVYLVFVLHSLTAAPLISYLPESTEELVSLYLKRNPDAAKSGLQTHWYSSALDSVVLDAVAYAHRSLLSQFWCFTYFFS